MQYLTFNRMQTSRKKRNLNNEEKAVLTKLTGLLQENKKDIFKRTEEGEKAHYANGEKISTSIYHRDIYYKGSETYYTNGWRFKRKEEMHKISLSMGNTGGSGNTEKTNTTPQAEYRVTKIYFELGTSIDHHYSQLKLNENRYPTVVEAVKGISGRIKIGRAGKLTISNAIASGRMRLLNGRVVERQNYTNTAIERNIPVLFNGNTIKLKFYTEDWNDYDFNDSYVTVTITNHHQPVMRVISNNTVDFSYTTEIRNIIGNVNISDIKIDYKHGANGEWVEIPTSDIQMVDGKLRLNIPNFSTSETYLRIRPQ